MEEKPLQDAIMSAILKMAKTDSSTLYTTRDCEKHSMRKTMIIRMYQNRIAAIEKEFQTILAGVTTENQSNVFSNLHIKELMHEKHMLETELEQYVELPQQKTASVRMQEIEIVLRTMKNHPVPYDDLIARQLLQSVVVESKHKIKVVFIGGMEVEELRYDGHI